MGIVGADLGLLGQLVAKLGGPDKSALDTALAGMNTAIQDSDTYWIGDYADTFRADFAKFAANVTRQLQQVLAQAAQITGQNMTAIATATGEAAGSASGKPGGMLNGSGAANNSLDGAGTAGELGTAVLDGAVLDGAVLDGAVLDGAGGATVNQSQVNAAIGYFDQNINSTEPRYGGGRFDYEDIPVGAQLVLQDWQKLTPAELNAVLASLSSQQLQDLDNVVAEASPAVQQAYAQMILKEADLSTIQQIESSLPDVPLEPSLPGGSNLTYQPVPAGSTLFGNSIDPNSQVNQGGLGDCYFLSSLAAVAVSDPAFIQSHITQNANGTYTVTLYQNGKPVEVTVLPDLPVNSDGGDAYDNIPDDGALWVALYEKAFAQLNGSYNAIGQGGWPQDALATITGKSTSSEAWNNSNTFEQIVTFGFGGNGSSPPSLASIQALIASGQPVTACTTGNDVWPDGDKNDPIEVVGDHCYRVQSVTSNPQTGQLMITLVNPWGPDGTGQALDTVTLTQQQFDAYYDEVAW
jgi:uncharacterized protein YukE